MPPPSKSSRWLVILCRFADIPAAPSDPPKSLFEEFFTASGRNEGGVFDYWRDVSNGAIDLACSTVVGWYTMKYRFGQDWALRRGTWIAEAKALAMANGIDLTPFDGVVAVVNAPVDDSALGPDFALNLGPAAFGERDWRLCKNCRALTFAGGGGLLGTCPSGGLGAVHDHAASGDYSVAHDYANFPGMQGFQRCTKCQTLVGADAGVAPCPAGGKHNGTGNYSVAYQWPIGPDPFVEFPVDQSGERGWRVCKKCWSLTNGDGGFCAAGGGHDHTGSSKFILLGHQTHLTNAFCAHEMGHTYGLAHSHSTTNPPTAAFVPYGDHWCVMGSAYSSSAGRFGRSACRPCAAASELLGLLPADRIWTYQAGAVNTVVLAPLNEPDQPGYLMARVVTPDRTYTIEYRRPMADSWDRSLPADGVLIHMLLPPDISPRLIPPQGHGEWDAHWQGGLTFRDPERDIRLLVRGLDQSPPGARITIDHDRSQGIGLCQLHTNGSIWQYTGPPMSGWMAIDNNPLTSTIAASGGGIYQLHRDGAIWKYTGPALSGWVQLDNNGLTTAIATADDGRLYQLHRNGSIWEYGGPPLSGWTSLDAGSAATAITTSGSGRLYKLHEDGSIWAYQVPGWLQLDANPATVAIVASGAEELYQLHRDGAIWEYTGPPMSGWRKLDHNLATVAIAPERGTLAQLHSDGSIWEYVRAPTPGWLQLDNNSMTTAIIGNSAYYGGGNLYQMHRDGSIWQYTGIPMTGWLQLDNNPLTAAIVPLK